VPRLVGVQSKRCGPIHEAFTRGLEDFAGVETGTSVAEGIAVQRPPRARAVLDAIRTSGGYTVAVDEDEIIDASHDLARMGLYVEPTSAVTLAAWRLIDKSDREGAVLILTGSGLKATAKYAESFPGS
jgi:threonine synthase